MQSIKHDAHIEFDIVISEASYVVLQANHKVPYCM